MTTPADFDPAALLDALDRHRVDYLVVGGVAAAAYGAQRLTHDLDVVADYDGDNLDRLSSALAEVGVRIRADGLDDDIARTLPAPNAETFRQLEISTWRTDLGDVDVLIALPSTDGASHRYADLRSRATVVTFADRSIRVAALGDIIESKRWADRPKDREALAELIELHAGMADPDRPGTD